MSKFLDEGLNANIQLFGVRLGFGQGRLPHENIKNIRKNQSQDRERQCDDVIRHAEIRYWHAYKNGLRVQA